MIEKVYILFIGKKKKKKKIAIDIDIFQGNESVRLCE